MIKPEITVADGVSPQLQDALFALRDKRPLLQKAGETLARALRAHFMARDREGNKHGWPRRRFWSREGRRNTALTRCDEHEAEVTIASEAIAHKLVGGAVYPKRGRALAIPNTAQAYRAIQPSAMDKDMLDYVPLKTGTGLVGMLIERQHDLLRRTKKGLRPGGLASRKGGTIWFWLVAKATHRPDPNTLPPDRELENTVYAAANNYLQAILDKAGVAT